MFDNEILTPNERIKKYRINILGATQEEIAQGICTKTWLSKVENNKRNLTENLAIGIAENFNKIMKMKGLNFAMITAEELMQDEDQQANHIFNNTMKELKEIKEVKEFDEKLLKSEKLIEEYNITDNTKIELYKLAADFYYYKHSYTKSDYLCDVGLKISINSQSSLNEVIFYIYKSRNNIFTSNYVKGLQQLDYAEKLNNLLKEDELSVMILFYKATTYKKLGEYDSSLECFEMLNQFQINDCNMLLRIKINHANCLNDYYKFNEAEKEYKEALNIAMEFNNKNIIAMIYRNLAELCINKKNNKAALMYIKESLAYNQNNEDRGEYLYFASKIRQNLSEEFEMELLEALEVCEQNDREKLDLIEKIIYELVLIYIEKNNEKKLILMADKAKVLNIDYSLVYSEIGEYYRGRKEEKSIYFYKKAREKMKQIKGI